MSDQDIQRMKGIKNYYDLLGVSKQATQDEIKRAYRKMALKFHPDKCKADGAQEVFKNIAKAYTCLSDPAKKRYYDQTGDEEPQHHSGGGGQYEEFDPQDLFNAFFGGGQFHGGRQYQRRPRQQHPQQFNLQGILQLLPLLLILFSGSFMNFFQEEPVYSFVRTYNHNIKRMSVTLDVEYFVTKDFDKKARDINYLKQIEFEIENIYVNNLRSTCYQHQQVKRQKMQQAKIQRSESNRRFYQNQANNIDMSSCKQLDKLQQQHNLDRYY